MIAFVGAQQFDHSRLIVPYGLSLSIILIQTFFIFVWVGNVLAKNFSGLLVNGSYKIQVINRE